MNNIFDEISAAEEAAQRADLAAAREAEAWLSVMNTDAGRRVIRALFDFADPLACSALDHASLAYREGQRSIGAHICAAVKAYAPEHFTTLFEEQA